MNIETTKIQGLFEITPRTFGDDRGYFYESYNANYMRDAGIETVFVQDNQSRSSKGILRGLHYQLPPYAQTKLVRVVEGAVLDVAVDIRPDSPTYGEWHSVLLSAENKKQLYIPHGFAHGFVVLTDFAEFLYKVDNFYHKESEGCVRYDDPTLAIDWQFDLSKVLVSDKDREATLFGEHRSFV